MERLNDVRINELGNGAALYAYEELTKSDEERKDYYEDPDSLLNLFEDRWEECAKYLAENFIQTAKELKILHDNTDEVVDEIMNEAISEFQMMYEDDNETK